MRTTMSDTGTHLDIPRTVVGSARHIFESSLAMDLTQIGQMSLREYLADGLIREEKRYLKEVTVYGDHEAHIILPFRADVAEFVAHTTLGMDEVKMAAFEGNDLIDESTNELTNQVAGCFRNILSRDEINCRLRPPRRLQELELAEWLNRASYRFIFKFQVIDNSLYVIYLRD